MRFLFGCVFVLFAQMSAPALAQDYDITAIVDAQARYSADPSDAMRTELLTALRDYTGEATVETLNAHLAVMANDSIAGDPLLLKESARLATAHLEPFQDVVPKQYIDSRFIAAVAAFNGEKDPEAVRELAHVEGFVHGIADEDGVKPDWASALGYQAKAWRMGMEAYFSSSRIDYPSAETVEAILTTYGADDASINAVANGNDADAGLPHCVGRMRQSPPLKYPYRKAKAGTVGAVILGLDFDPDGNVINPKVLASVPADAFDDLAIRVVNQWRFRPQTPRDVGVKCQLERTNVVQPVVFLLD